MVLAITKDQVEQMAIPKSIVLHLFPGIFIVIFDILAASFVEELGFPTLLTLILADLLILIPVELAILLYMSKKENDSFNIKQLIPYFEPLPLKNFIGFFLLTFVWAFLVNMLMFPVTAFLSENIFAWMPDVFFSNDQATLEALDFTQYSQTNLLIVLILAILGIGIGVPIVEELYFRGYLMSRISRYSAWTSVITVALWALYHFWAPWSFFAYLLAFIPVAFVVLKTKNLYIAILGHMIANLFLVISLVPLMLV
ncbi:MAG: CPBP family intramembrane glutamic endopeptidase [Candidatus Hodarchaeales archaeon]